MKLKNQYNPQKKLIEIHSAYNEILQFKSETNLKICELGLVIRVYFTFDQSIESYQKIIKIYRKFWNEHYSVLKTHLPNGSGHYVKLTEKSFLIHSNKLIDALSKSQTVFWILSSNPKSDTTSEEVSSTSLFCNIHSSDYKLSEKRVLSDLKFIFPISYLNSLEKLQEFEDWINYLSTELDVIHGYAGLTIQNADQRGCHPYWFHFVLKKYWGITLDLDEFNTYNWKKGIKTISWYTFVADNLFHQVEKNLDISLLEKFKIKYWKIDHVNIFKASTYPSLIQRDNLNDNKNYLMINHLLKPIQTYQIYDSIMRYLDWVFMFYWLKRLNIENLEDVLNYNTEPKRQKLIMLGSVWTTKYSLNISEYHNFHQFKWNSPEKEYFMRVPITGIWKPFNFDGISQYLKAEQEFPQEAEYTRQSGNIGTSNAIWQLIQPDNDQTALFDNPF